MTERARAQDAVLLPCPFCGSVDLIHHMAYGAVQCQQCMASGPQSESSPNSLSIRTSKWNTRPAPPPDARDETIRRLHKTIMRMCADEVRLDWLIENAATTGGGHGVTLTVFIPHDSEDVRDAIDGARAALKDAP